MGAHTIGVWIDHNLGGPAIDARCFPDPFDKAFDGVERKLPARTVVRRIEGAEAAARWRAAVERTDTTFASLVDDSMRALGALVLARAASMPADGDVPAPAALSSAQRDEILKEFERSPFVAALAEHGIDPERARELGSHCMTYALDHAAGTPLRFSPVMVEIFCTYWAPRKVVGEQADLQALPHVLRAWIRFCGRRRGIPEPRIEEAVAAVDEHERTLRAAALDPKTWGPAKATIQTMIARGGDPSDRKQLESFVAQINSGEAPLP